MLQPNDKIIGVASAAKKNPVVSFEPVTGSFSIQGNPDSDCGTNGRSIGTFVAGTYRFTYDSGAICYSAFDPNCWNAGRIRDGDCGGPYAHRCRIIVGGVYYDLPGFANGGSMNAAAAEALAVGQNTDFSLPAGEWFVQFNDAPGSTDNSGTCAYSFERVA